MDLNHLHLHVRDLEVSRRFYERYFGFRERVRHGEILFLTNEQGFDLALALAASVETFPSWFHFGFRLTSADQVRSLYGRMATEGVPVPRGICEEPDLVSYRCLDPDGYGVEVYWE